jgi:hypothetical protein
MEWKGVGEWFGRFWVEIVEVLVVGANADGLGVLDVFLVYGLLGSQILQILFQIQLFS